MNVREIPGDERSVGFARHAADAAQFLFRRTVGTGKTVLNAAFGVGLGAIRTFASFGARAQVEALVLGGNLRVRLVAVVGEDVGDLAEWANKRRTLGNRVEVWPFLITRVPGLTAS